MLGTKHLADVPGKSPNPEQLLLWGSALAIFPDEILHSEIHSPNSRQPSLGLPPLWALLAHSLQRELQNTQKLLPSALWSTQRHKPHLQEQRLRVLQAGIKVITSTCSLSHHPDLPVYRKSHKGLFLIAIILGEDKVLLFSLFYLII